MPRYYFHAHNRLGETRDEEGRELESVEHALRAAIRDARSIVAGEAEEGMVDLTGRIEIADAEGSTVASVAYRDAVELRL